MVDEVALQWFDVEKFNARISEKEDKIVYKQILVPKSSTNKGVQHIQERHIDDIVKCFCAVWIPEPQAQKPVLRYMDNLGLSESFKEYYLSMVCIGRRIERLSKKINYSFRDLFRGVFYGLDLPMAKRIVSLASAPGVETAHLNEVLENLSLRLKQTRDLLSCEDLENVELSVLDVLSKCAEDPAEIWKEGNVHAYVAEFKLKSQKKFVCFVTVKDGRLFTAYFKKPEFPKSEDCYVIYTRPKGMS